MAVTVAVTAPRPATVLPVMATALVAMAECRVRQVVNSAAVAVGVTAQRAVRMAPRGKSPAQAIKYVGAKTFFLRGEQWIDSAVVDRECEKQTVKRSSDDSFTLLTKHGRDVAKYLAMEGDVVVQFGKDVYLVTD